MTSTYQHVASVTGAMRNALHEWTRDILEQSGLELPVAGSILEGDDPALVLLAYQVIMESTPGIPQVPVMPMTGDGRRDSIPQAWKVMAKGMTEVLLDKFPKRERKAAGIGPLEPCPTLAELPKPLQDWYAANDAFRVDEQHGRLPQISWRQPFSLVVRFAGMVQGAKHPADLLQLQALSVLAAGIRQERYFSCPLPPAAHSAQLDALIDAFAASADEPLRSEMQAAAVASRSPGTLAVGVFPHHDLTDQDLALVMQALRLPMQPAVVFGARLSLGGGPELLTGAMPHLGSVEKVPQ